MIKNNGILTTNTKIFLLIGMISALILTAAIIWNDLNFSFFLGLLFDDAKELAQKGTIVSDFMPIGYSGFLGLCLKLGGEGAIPACQATVYAGVLLAVFWFLSYACEQNLGFPPRLNRETREMAPMERGGSRGRDILLTLGILVIALHPTLILNVWRVHDGNPTTLLLLGFLAAGISFSRFGKIWSVFAMGIFAGLISTIRPNTILLALLAFLFLYRKNYKKRGDRLKEAAVFLVSVAIVFMAVNITIKHKPLFLPQYGPYNLFAGANEYTTKHLLQSYGAENSLEEALRARGLSSVEGFEERLYFPPEEYKRLAIDYVKNHPLEYAKLVSIKIITLIRPGYHVTENFTWGSGEGLKRVLKIILALPFFIWMFFIWKTRKNFFERENLFVFFVIVLYALPFLIANADPRYRFPLDIVFIADSFRRASGGGQGTLFLKKFMVQFKKRK